MIEQCQHGESDGSGAQGGIDQEDFLFGADAGGSVLNQAVAEHVFKRVKIVE